MKLCKDCKHYYSGMCARDSREEISLVTGEFYMKGILRNCFKERKAKFFGCGAGGRFFKERDETV